MREGGDILALGKNLKEAIDSITVDLPHWHSAISGSRSGGDGKAPSPSLCRSLWQAVAIILVVVLVYQPWHTSGVDDCRRYSLDARDRILDHGTDRHRCAAHIAGALIIARTARSTTRCRRPTRC